MVRRSRLVAAAAIAALTAGMLAGAAGLPASAKPPGVQNPNHPSDPAARTVTLITGDKVLVGAGRAGHERVTFVPGGTNPSDSIRVLRQNGRTYVIPSSARAQLRKLDPALFDVTTLVQQGYDDKRMSSVPLIVRYNGKAPKAAPKGATRTEDLASISADGLRASKRTAATFWQNLQQSKGISRIWLDRKVKVSLDRSVPQIGAPQAWEKGFDGEGVTVAVVDTGVDANHPDLAGKVVASQNFSDAADAADHFGHGTHVASIVAGTGAAVGGKYKGVAPQAKLISAKVLDDNGNGWTSDVIEGMEWSAAQGAKVVNLSLGSGPTDGTDPASVAVNELTEQTGALFVIAAGNDGSRGPERVSSPSTADAALSVGAVDREDALADFSSTGPRMNDRAMKPEITGPGVGIVAAKAAGTELGEPVGEHYVTLDGTSMATPHVAGAAAILAQQHPDWKAEQLKAALMSTAKPNDTNSVYEQGAGRVDVAHAVNATLHASVGKLDLGYIRWPHENPAPVTREITYINSSDAAVMIDLSIALDGVPADAWTISPQALEVPANGSATAEVTLRLDGLDTKHYGGFLAAEVAGTDEVLSVPAGFYFEPEMYDLTVKGIDRAGNPDGDVLTLLDVDDGSWHSSQPWILFENGTAKVRIPPGKYSAGAFLSDDPTDTSPQQYTLGVDPEVDVHADTTVVLDGRTAKPASIEVKDAPRTDNRSKSVGYVSAVRSPDGQFANWGGTQLSADESLSQLYAIPSKPAETSEFEYNVRSRLVTPQITLNVAGAPEVKLEPRFMPLGPRANGRWRLPVVDFQPGDSAEGAIALIDLTPGTEPGPLAVEAAEAGAKLVLMYDDSEPGRLGSWCCGGGVDDPGIPIIVTNRVAAAQLKDLLAKGEVRIDVTAVDPVPVVYDLAMPVAGRVPADPSFAVDQRRLAKLDVSFGAHVPQQRSSETRTALTPLGAEGGQSLIPFVPTPSKRTEYVLSGEVAWSQSFMPLNAGIYVSYSELPRTYRPGQKATVRWNHPAATHSLPDGSWNEVTRNGTQFTAFIGGFADQPDRRDDSFGDTHRMRLYQGDQLLAEDEGNFLGAEVPEGAATYRLEMDSQRSYDWWKYSTKVSSSWTIKSAGGESERLPVLLASYDVPTADPSSQVWAGDLVPIQLGFRHQAGAKAAKLASVALAQSYDDGRTWQPVTALRVGEGKYLALVKHAKSQAGKAVSLRVDAKDAEGNRLVQTVTRAYGIR